MSQSTRERATGNRLSAGPIDFFLSYPKSGRTWIRFMLDAYMAEIFGISTRNVFEVEAKVAANFRLEWTHFTAAMHMRLPYYQSGCFDPHQIDGKACLFLTRNFYSTLASAFYQARDRIGVFRGSPSQFVRSSRYGALKLVTFYNMVADLRERFRHFVAFSYEDLRRDPAAHLRRVLEEMQLPIDQQLLSDVVDRSTFDGMKRLSVAPEYAGTPLAPGDRHDLNTYKVRFGTNHSFRQLFDEDSIDFIAKTIEVALVDKSAPYLKDAIAIPQEPLP